MTNGRSPLTITEAHERTGRRRETIRAAIKREDLVGWKDPQFPGRGRYLIDAKSFVRWAATPIRRGRPPKQLSS